MEDRELLQYALEHGMINVSYVQEQMEMNERRELLDPTISEVFDEWNDRRLPICGDFFAFMGGFSMGERYTRYSTANDVMKEFLIYGAELTEMGFPILPPAQMTPSGTIDFRSGLNRSFKDHHNTSCNFYIDDEKFNCAYSMPDKYLNYLKLFQCVLGLDFSIDTQMPLIMQYWNKYRSMALDWYLTLNGITVIPNVNIIPYEGREWLLDGLPKHSTISCSTNGRVRSKGARVEFCEGFYEMCEILEPTRVVVVGILPDELDSPVEIINFENRAQKMRDRLSGGKYCEK